MISIEDYKDQYTENGFFWNEEIEQLLIAYDVMAFTKEDEHVATEKLEQFAKREEYRYLTDPQLQNKELPAKATIAYDFKRISECVVLRQTEGLTRV